ncbi:hypothetical protein [Polaromonas sp. CG9_12]|nr:hypothetical protein [Polaromonas sp. CG9_12]
MPSAGAHQASAQFLRKAAAFQQSSSIHASPPSNLLKQQ